MAISIRNASAFGTLNNTNRATRAANRAMERLSSGYRISRAADDAAGLGVAENLRASYRSSDVAARNIADGIAAVSVGEAATSAVGDIMIRLREIAVQGSTETLTSAQRSYLESEADSLMTEITRIADSTSFNGTSLTNVSGGQAIGVQVGINDDSSDVLTVTFGDLSVASRFSALQTTVTALSSVSNTTFSNLIGAVDTALVSVNTTRAAYGAAENSLTNAQSAAETYSAAAREAESVIRDADFGAETMELSRQQVLQQVGVAVIAQARTLNQSVISLLQ
jgi:flagellin